MNLQAAIHISSSAVCTVIGDIEKNGDKSRLKIIAVGLAHTDAFHQGQIVYREHLIPAIHKSMQEAMDMSHTQILNPLISFATPLMVSGNWIKRVEVKSDECIVEAEDLYRAYQQINDDLLQEQRAILQRCQQIVYLDNDEQVRDVVGLRSKNIDVACHVMSVPINTRQQMVDLFQDQNIACDTMIFDGVAGAAYALNENEKRQGVCYVDIGTTMTKVCVYHDGLLLFTDCLPIGGELVDMDIAKECGVDLQDAASFKRQEGTLNGDKYHLGAHVIYKKYTKNEKTMLRCELNQVIQARYYEIFAQIVNRLRKNNLLAAIDAGIVLAGGGSQMDGLEGFVRSKFGIPTRLVTKNARIRLDPTLSDDNIKVLKKHLEDNTLHSAIGTLLYAESEQFARDQQAQWIAQPSNSWFANLLRNISLLLDKIKKYI